jgi:hypothetical protein
LCHPRTKKRHWAILTAEQTTAALDALAGIPPRTPDVLSSPILQQSSSPSSVEMQDYVSMDTDFDTAHGDEKNDEEMDVSGLKSAVFVNL